MSEISDRVTAISQQMRAFEAEIKKLRAICPHPEFMSGITMVACIQEVLICKDCGHAKPIPRHLW